MSGRQLRWRGGVAAAVLLAVAGVVDQNGQLLLAASIPLIYVVYGSVSRAPAVDALSAERRIEPQPAPPGTVVTIGLRITNDGDRTVPDFRVADGVPEDLAVLDGSPRAGTTLEPGESVTLHYRTIARRGEYDFAPPEVRLRGFGAGAVATTTVPVEGEATLVCRLDADAPPIEDYGRGQVGTLTTDDPGSGISFHSVREYHPDDSADRIDWRHYAKRGELATVNYERRVSATVVVVVDARAGNFVVAGRGRPTAVELSAYAATHVVTDLLQKNHDVGVAVLGLNGPGPAGLHWLPPKSGAEQRSRALELFRTAVDADPPPKEGLGQARKLLELVPPGTQITLCSPVLDDTPVTAAETWLGAGMPVSILSADVVPGSTVSGQYSTVRRRTRLTRAQAAGARVFDWQRGTPLPLVVEHAVAAEARTAGATAGGGR